MFKVIFSFALMCLSVTSFAQEPNPWVPFKKEFKIAAEAIVRDDHLHFWAMPFAEDTESIAAARAMILEMDTINYRENPFLIRFALAGVKYAYNRQTAVTPLIDEVEDYLSKERGPAYLICKGYFASERITRCIIEYENQTTEQAALLEAGYLTILDDLFDVPGDYIPAMRAASDRARAEERGIWAPFFFMLQDMQGGQ